MVFVTIWRDVGIRSFRQTMSTCRSVTCGSASSPSSLRLWKDLYHLKWPRPNIVYHGSITRAWSGNAIGYTFVLESLAAQTLRIITNSSEHMFRRWLEMHIGNIYPISSHLKVLIPGERGGSVVECRTPEREVGGSKPTAAVLCPWARYFTPRKYWLITQEAVAPSRHDWKIVDWDSTQTNKQSPDPGSPKYEKMKKFWSFVKSLKKDGLGSHHLGKTVYWKQTHGIRLTFATGSSTHLRVRLMVSYPQKA